MKIRTHARSALAFTITSFAIAETQWSALARERDLNIAAVRIEKCFGIMSGQIAEIRIDS